MGSGITFRVSAAGPRPSLGVTKSDTMLQGIRSDILRLILSVAVKMSLEDIILPGVSLHSVSLDPASSQARRVRRSTDP